jgi:sugar O-acyltransferase (sialic acid O-acetyltransferase NeuD family)
MDINIIGKSNEVFKYTKDYDIFVAIGNNKIREEFHYQLEKVDAKIPIIIHPRAVIGEQVDIGEGTVIMAGTVINCCCKIGKGVIVNTGATIDHDNVLRDYVHISPGVHTAGSVEIGKCSWIGIGATICNNVKVTSGCMVGAGTVVVVNLNETGTYVGVPARRI